MAELLEIAKLGNSILRQIAQPVSNVTDATVQALINSLIATATSANGVGIAAPQVSQSYRLFILASRPNSRYPNAPLMEATAIINPKIVVHSDEVIKGWEGCLSVPGIRGLVPRSRAIAVEYYDRYGNLQHQEFTDFVARIFQHELDHLNGIVFLDRVESDRDLLTEEEYQRLLQNI
jgi:peptide deformylase